MKTRKIFCKSGPQRPKETYLSLYNRIYVRDDHRHRIDKYLDTLLANQPISDGEATDRCKTLRRKMADCQS